MSTISSLNIYLNAQADGFAKGVQAATKETVRFMMQMDLQARTLGMSATEAKLYQLQMRGVEQSLIDVARETANTVEAMKSQRAATDAARALVNELQLQAQTFHMTADAAQIYRLELQGADKAVIQAARDHALFIQFLREEKAAMDAAAVAARNQAAAFEASIAASARGQAAAVAAATAAANSKTAATPASAGLLGMLGQAKGIGGMLKGGGALAGIGIIASQLKMVSDKLLELTTAYRAGEISAKEFAAEGVRGIPILGNAVKFFDNIRDSYYGWSAAAEAVMKVETSRQAQLEKQIAGLARYKEIMTEVKEVLTANTEATRWEIDMMKKSPFGAAVAEIGKANREANKELKDEAKKRIDEINRMEAEGTLNAKNAATARATIAAELAKALAAQDELAAKKTGQEVAGAIGEIAKAAYDATAPLRKLAEAMNKAKKEKDEFNKKQKIKDQIENLKTMEQSLKDEMEANKTAFNSVPRKLEFASVASSTGDTGIGSTFKAALQTSFGLDRSKSWEKLQQEQKDLLKRIEENTRQQKIAQARLN